uniref:Putative ovule protein n=1 Tax=Solanum chacoense TaxID=4108 RepID=A0A0V0HBD3_SOLCH
MALIVNNKWILNAIQIEDPSSNKSTRVDCCTVCTHHHPRSWLSSLYLLVFDTIFHPHHHTHQCFCPSNTTT